MKTKLPEGWKEEKLGEVLDYEQPTKYIVKSTKYDDKFKTPVLTAGKSFLKGYTNETEGIREDLPVIIFDDFTTASQFVTFPFKVKSSAMKILTTKRKDVNLKYIFYLMQTIKFDSKTHKRYYLSKYQNLNIPLPPLKTQEAIVSLLEKAEKAKKLRDEADELSKDYLKSVFVDMFIDKGFINKPLGEIADVKRGQTITKKTVIKGDVPVIAGGQKPAYYHNQSNRDGNIITVSASGAYAGFVNFFKQPIFASDCSTIKGNDLVLKTSFIYHYLKTIQEKIYKSQRGAGQPHVYAKDLEKIKIPLPPIELQNKFAEIVKQVESMKEHQKESKEQIDDLFNALMQKAFKGELKC